MSQFYPTVNPGYPATTENPHHGHFPDSRHRIYPFSPGEQMMGPGGVASMPNGAVTVNQTGIPKTCAACAKRIQDRFLLLAMDRYWHTACLKCSCCQAPLGDIGSSCFTKAGMILCRNDYVRLFGSGGSCSACCQPIPASELVMRAQTNVYHLKCFTCCTCHTPLNTGDRYGIVQGSLVCEQDFPKVVRGLTPLPNRTTHK
ncbi:LIM domain transcription factor LMO4, partial [Biomphalaria glabrata]